MGDYHDMYLQLDVLLLADFFEKFHRTCLDFYKLDPLHYFTTPGLARDAALRMSHVDLELITNENIYNMVENSIRGGISMISTPHAKANNPRLPSYDPELPRQDLIYLDANNLYHHAMSQYLPTGGFRLLNKGEIEALDLDDLDDEVDLEYPVELHDKHDDYPLAPESLVIDRSMYSPIQSSVFPESLQQKKLTPNLNNKERYVVHYRNLKLYTQLGFVITKIQRVLKFNQSPWLKQYIDFNTRQRSLAESGFLKDFFKLMNNSVFGKTQENFEKRVQVDIVTDSTILRKIVAKPSFCHGIPITDDNTVVQCKVQTLMLNRPIYVGYTVLELSKLHMHDFHYNHMKAKYPYADQLHLLFTDTDSLAYAVQTDDIYEDMAVDDKYDFSEYPLSHPLYNTSNKKSIEYFKDELNSIPMEEFVGLRPKCYAFKHSGKVDKNVVQRRVRAGQTCMARAHHARR